MIDVFEDCQATALTTQPPRHSNVTDILLVMNSWQISTIFTISSFHQSIDGFNHLITFFEANHLPLSFRPLTSPDLHMSPRGLVFGYNIALSIASIFHLFFTAPAFVQAPRLLAVD